MRCHRIDGARRADRSVLTIVFTDVIPFAEASNSFKYSIHASLNGIEMAHPRIPSARIPPIAEPM
jgi:hypothetical protein